MVVSVAIAPSSAAAAREVGASPLAVVVSGPSQAKVVPYPTSSACGPGEALIKVAVVGVCATDIELFDGSMGFFEAGLSTWPFVPGHEWAGEIAALGEGCLPHLVVGQRVIGEHCTGCEEVWSHRERQKEVGLPLPLPPPRRPKRRRSNSSSEKYSGVSLVKAFSNLQQCNICAIRGGFLRCPGRAETGFFQRDGAFQTLLRFPAAQLHVIPDTVPWDLAGLAEPLAVVHKGVRIAGLTGEAAAERARSEGAPRVVVVGDGCIGLMTVQVLRWAGARVICVVGTLPSRLERAATYGAEAVWNILERGTEGLEKFIEEDGEAPRYVFEAAGKPEAVGLAVRLVATGGTLLLLGLNGNKPSEVRADDIVLRQLTVRGSLSSDTEDWPAVVDILASGIVKSVVTHTLRGLESYHQAIQMVAKPPQDMLKVILLPQPEDA